MQKPLCVSIECQHLSKAVRVTIARLDGLTAGMLKQSLNVKEKGQLPTGYLSLVIAAQGDSDPPIIVSCVSRSCYAAALKLFVLSWLCEAGRGRKCCFQMRALQLYTDSCCCRRTRI